MSTVLQVDQSSTAILTEMSALIMTAAQNKRIGTADNIFFYLILLTKKILLLSQLDSKSLSLHCLIPMHLLPGYCNIA